MSEPSTCTAGFSIAGLDADAMLRDAIGGLLGARPGYML